MRHRGGPRRVAVLLASIAAALASLALAAAPAFAERSYDSQITGFTNPHGIAIDGSDHAWVSDPGSSGLITEYNAYPSQTSIGQRTGGGAFECGGIYDWSLGINDSNGNLDVADSCTVKVDIFDGTGAFLKKFASEFGGGYDYLAVDNSAGPTNGDIYVASSNGLLQRFDASGSPDGFSGSAGYISGNRITGTPGGSFGTPWNVATDSSGNVYLLDQTHRAVDEFDSSGTFVRAFDGSGAPGGFSSGLSGVAVDPTNGNVLVADANNLVVDEFESNGAYLDQLTGTGPTEETPFRSLPGGIAVNSAGYVYVADGVNHVVDIFTSNAILPKVSYGAVTDQSQTGGTLNADIDLNGGPEVTSCHFQYGTTTEYGSSVACSPPTPYSGNTSVSASLSGLTTEQTYHYRLVLVTANGTKNSPDQTYIPHAVAGLTTEPATNVARNTATLNASFNGDGEDTHYYFEWGTSPSYGNTTAAPPGSDAGSPNIPQALHFDLSGLTVETTYHYRVVASNAAGTSYGADQSFKTLAAVENLATEPPTNVTASTATLNASYTGIGEDVHYYFEFGPDTEYGSTTAAPPGTDNGSPSGAQTLSFDVGALGINQTYHYRVVASDAAGTTFGADQTFTTLGRYEFATDYGSAGSGDGQLLGPKDVAVDASSGDLYVADTGNHRVVKLDSSGHFLAAWGWGVSDGSAAAEVCTSGCQAGIPGSGAGQFTTPEFVEVDNSAGASAGDVYVADIADGVVQKFDPSGNLITSWETGGKIDFSSSGTIGGITVSVTGDLLVLTDNSPYYWTEIGQDGSYERRINTAGLQLGSPSGTGIEIDSFGGFYEPQENGSGVTYRDPEGVLYSGHLIPAAGNAGLVIDRSTNDLYVDQGGFIQQFATVVPPGCAADAGAGTIGQGCGATDTFGSGSLSGGAGLGFNPGTGMLYAADAGANDVAVFSPLPLPDVTTGPATGVDASSWTLTGKVDPHGAGQVSDCYFQYGTDQTYASGSIPCSPGAPLSGPSDVSADLSGLTPSTTYHYRLVAIRADGKGLPAYGRDRTFTASPTLAPTIESSSFADSTPTTATVTAQINPNLLPTVYRFQYGTETDYGSQTPTSESIGEDGAGHTVSSQLSGLTPGATYHYRVVAVNFNGTVNGPDGTFTTPDVPSVAAGAALNVSQTSASLTASIRPGFRSTTYHFEYGSSASYGSSTSESSPIGSDDSVHPVAADISGLSPATTYHFRVVANNPIGTTDGPDQSFTTAPVPIQVPQQPRCKAGFVNHGGKCVKRRHRKHKHKKRSNP